MPKTFDKFSKNSETDFYNWMADFTSLGTKGHELFEAVLDNEGNASLIATSPNFLFRLISWIFKPESRRINTVIEVALGKLKANAEHLSKTVDELEKMQKFFYSGKGEVKKIFINQFEELLAVARINNASTDILIMAKKEAAATCDLILAKAHQEKKVIKDQQCNLAKERRENALPKADKIKDKADLEYEGALEILEKTKLDKDEIHINAAIEAVRERHKQKATKIQKDLVVEGNLKNKKIFEECDVEVRKIQAEMDKEIRKQNQLYPSLFNAFLIINKNNQLTMSYFDERLLPDDQEQLPYFIRKLSKEKCPPKLQRQMDEEKIQSIYELWNNQNYISASFSYLGTFLQTGEGPENIRELYYFYDFAKRNQLNKVAQACLEKFKENLTPANLYDLFKILEPNSEMAREAFKAIESMPLDQFQDVELAKDVFYSGYKANSFYSFNDHQKALIAQFEIKLLHPLRINPHALEFHPRRPIQLLSRAVCNLLKAKGKEGETLEERDAFLSYIIDNILLVSHPYDLRTVMHQGVPGERIIDHLKHVDLNSQTRIRLTHLRVFQD